MATAYRSRSRRHTRHRCLTHLVRSIRSGQARHLALTKSSRVPRPALLPLLLLRPLLQTSSTLLKVVCLQVSHRLLRHRLRRARSHAPISFVALVSTSQKKRSRRKSLRKCRRVLLSSPRNPVPRRASLPRLQARLYHLVPNHQSPSKPSPAPVRRLPFPGMAAML